MANKGKISMLSLFQNVDFKSLSFLSKFTDLESILSQKSLQPQNIKDVEYDPNDYLIQPKGHLSKKKGTTHNEKDVKIPRNQQKNVKVYKKGPFAQFYQLNQQIFDKDAEVWYYKDGKQIIGPVSSYNMDKMVYHKTITSETRVAFKSLDKFVKFSKIQKVLEDAKTQAEQKLEKEKAEETKQVEKPIQKQIQKIELQEKVVSQQIQKTQVKKPIKQTIKGVPNLNDPEEFPSL